MKTKLWNIGLGIILLLAMVACEEDITLEIPQGEESLVVEGYIEPGMPPIVMVTRTLPYFSESSIDILNSIFVSGADVRIYDGKDTIKLMEINLSTLPDSIAKLLLETFQLSGDLLGGLNITIYTSIQLFGEVGKTYTLLVEKDKNKLKARTTIPEPVKIDSVWYEHHPNPTNDSLVIVYFAFHDPPNQDNYYRLYNAREKEPFYPNPFISVSDDKLVDGNLIKLNTFRGQASGMSFDETYGFFKKGDSVTVKLCQIDRVHYDFWKTFESSRMSGGPFANPVYILSNVEGGLGVWGGYGASFFGLRIPE